MDATENREGLVAAGQERREEPRLPVDEEASLLLVSQGSRPPCRLVEVSLTGCRIRTLDRFARGSRARVEAAFKLRGVAFRFSGETEWTDGKYLVGIRFVDVNARRRDELVEVLCEIAAENATRAVKEAAKRLAEAESLAAAESATQATPIAPALTSNPTTKSTPATPTATVQKTSPAPEPAPRLVELATRRPEPLGPVAASPKPVAVQGRLEPLSQTHPAAPPPAKPSGRERRGQSRHDVDTSATILLVNVASRIQGRILNLSLGGCRIRTEDRFPVGIYTRVETEFHLEGLPFRLGGVVQAIHERQFVGIRFLDMSYRKKEQVEQLIDEIAAMNEQETTPDPPAAGDQTLS
jgi:c-di-GMP-binding flagellar brake protein YcgR